MTEEKLVKFGSIGLLHNVLEFVDHGLETGAPVYPGGPYRAKPKLHGTFRAVQVHPDGTVVTQARRFLLDEEEDHYDFRKWVLSDEERFRSAGLRDVSTTFFGEWCGPKIQKGTAANKLQERIFAVFAVLVGDNFVIKPGAIKRCIQGLPPQVVAIPFLSKHFYFTWSDRDKLREEVKEVEAYVDQIGDRDIWLWQDFGVDGPGEGVVLYPTDAPFQGNKFLTMKYMFKAKTEKYKTQKTKTRTPIDPEVAASVDAFIEMFVTEARLEQGFFEVCDNVLDQTKTGAFIKWVSKDVMKESEAELAASGLTWKQVAKRVSAAAGKWYREQFNII